MDTPPNNTPNGGARPSQLAELRGYVLEGRGRKALALARDLVKLPALPPAQLRLAVRGYEARLEELLAAAQPEEAARLFATLVANNPHWLPLFRPETRLACQDPALLALFREPFPADAPVEHPLSALILGGLENLQALAESAHLPAAHPLKGEAAGLLAAWKLVEARHGAGAEAALAAVSRRSPLYPWRLFIQLLDAFYGSRDAELPALAARIPAASPLAKTAAALAAGVTAGGGSGEGGGLAALRMQKGRESGAHREEAVTLEARIPTEKASAACLRDLAAFCDRLAAADRLGLASDLANHFMQQCLKDDTKHNLAFYARHLTPAVSYRAGLKSLLTQGDAVDIMDNWGDFMRLGQFHDNDERAAVRLAAANTLAKLTNEHFEEVQERIAALCRDAAAFRKFPEIFARWAAADASAKPLEQWHAAFPDDPAVLSRLIARHLDAGATDQAATLITAAQAAPVKPPDLPVLHDRLRLVSIRKALARKDRAAVRGLLAAGTWQTPHERLAAEVAAWLAEDDRKAKTALGKQLEAVGRPLSIRGIAGEFIPDFKTAALPLSVKNQFMNAGTVLADLRHLLAQPGKIHFDGGIPWDIHRPIRDAAGRAGQAVPESLALLPLLARAPEPFQLTDNSWLYGAALSLCRNLLAITPAEASAPILIHWAMIYRAGAPDYGFRLDALLDQLLLAAFLVRAGHPEHQPLLDQAVQDADFTDLDDYLAKVTDKMAKAAFAKIPKLFAAQVRPLYVRVPRLFSFRYEDADAAPSHRRGSGGKTRRPPTAPRDFDDDDDFLEPGELSEETLEAMRQLMENLQKRAEKPKRRGKPRHPPGAATAGLQPDLPFNFEEEGHAP
jgi:hypothetical protein